MMLALVDCNNFFVSCERVFDLSLVGKPVAILSNNDGCIIARSNELKALGIKMGVPYFQVRDFMRQNRVVIRSSNFELYSDLSNRVMHTLAAFTPELEVYSVDEAFLHLPDTAKDTTAFARDVRKRVLKEVGIPTGVGIAPTKTLAKIANHIAKKSKAGIFCMPEDRMTVLKDYPVDDVWGIGRKTVAKLAAMGIRTVGALLALDRAFLQKTFSINMLRLVDELNGQVSLDTVDPEEQQQSLMVSRSFGHPVTDPVEMEESVTTYTAMAAGKLRAKNLRTAGVTITYVYYPEYGPRTAEGGTVSENVVFPEALNETVAMMSHIRPVLDAMFDPSRRYKKSCVTCWGLSDADTVQQDLFADEKPKTSAKVYAVMDKLNKRLGKRTVFHLSEGTEQSWFMRRDHLSPHYTTDWDALLKVK